MATAERVLTRRELNRALLHRQLLLERHAVTAVRAVERLGGLQAQSTPSPYLSLWTRLEGFERDELVRALTGRRLVKALLQRGTLHIVTPRDYWAITTARNKLGGILWPPSYEARLPAARIEALAEEVVAELRGSTKSFKEISALLEPHGRPPHVTPTFLWRRIQGKAYVVHVPRRESGGTADRASTRPRRNGSGAARRTPRRRSTTSSAAISRPTGRRPSRTSVSGQASRASLRSRTRWSGCS